MRARKIRHVIMMTSALTAILATGCSSLIPNASRDTDTDTTIESRSVDLSKREADLADARSKIDKEYKALMAKEAELAKKEKIILEAADRTKSSITDVNTIANENPPSSPPAATQSNVQDDQFPPNSKPGECYARVLIPAQYEIQTEKVVKREAGTQIETMPAKFVLADEKILVRDASKELTVVPATYETVTENVMVKPASSELVEVPARYKTVSEKVLDKPAHTIWKRSSAALGTIGQQKLPTRIDEATGEVMCLVEVPATYKTVSKTVLASPASVKEVPVPAEFKTITRTILKTPAKTTEVVIPAEYKTVKVQKLVSPAQTKEVPIPAEYQSITKRKKTAEEELMWRQVVCDINLTEKMVANIQQAANESGYYKGPVDGIMGPMTLSAVNGWAKDKGFPVSQNYIPIDTIKAMGVK